MNSNILFPKVSVGIVAYNQSSLIRDTIESVLQQDYPNLEIVIADDCSTDTTPQILQEYSVKYPQKIVLLLNQKNVGITKNSNVVLRGCSGDLIVLMGGDDLMLPGKISKQVAYLQSNPECSICYHDMVVLDERKKSDGELYSQLFKTKLYKGDIATQIKYGTFNCASSCMFRAIDIPIGGFDESTTYSSDYLFWVEILSKGGEIHPLTKALGVYRRHSKNVTADATKQLQLFQDHAVSCAVMLLKYPAHTNLILLHLSNILRGARKIQNKTYLTYLFASISVKFNYRSILLLIIYFVSLGKVCK